jgi:hypothetical protein
MSVMLASLLNSNNCRHKGDAASEERSENVLLFQAVSHTHAECGGLVEH